MAPTACVTGATGFVASELIRQLLTKGYTVKATARRGAGDERVQHLQRAVAALPGVLHIVEADLLAPGAFDAAVAGCEVLFHVASPFQIEVADAQRDLIAPAVEGTRNVMGSAVKAKGAGLRRVVLTSSVCAIHDMGPKAVPKSGSIFTEEDWNEVSVVDSEPYWVSKVEAERMAWALAKEHGLDLVTILPNFVLGPPVFAGAAAGLSGGFVKAFLEAPEGKVPDGDCIICDVRDVAAAHVLAAETPSASGRYIISQSHSIPGRAITDALKARLPGLDIPDGKEQPVRSNISSAKAARELGLQLRAPEVTVADMAEALVALGVAQPKMKTPAA